MIIEGFKKRGERYLNNNQTHMSKKQTDNAMTLKRKRKTTLCRTQHKELKRTTLAQKKQGVFSVIKTFASEYSNWGK